MKIITSSSRAIFFITWSYWAQLLKHWLSLTLTLELNWSIWHNFQKHLSNIDRRHSMWNWQPRKIKT